MSKPLALEWLKVAGYRCIGRPGVVIEDLQQVNIIVGANGVGKSSLIEAIKLGLTGTIRRRGIEVSFADLICREDEPGLSTEVVVGFGENLSSRFVFRDAGSFADASEAARAWTHRTLAANDKHDERAVADLLRLCHFLPQGWGERLPDLEPLKVADSLRRSMGYETLSKDLESLELGKRFGKQLDLHVKMLASSLEEARSLNESWHELVAELIEAEAARQRAAAGSAQGAELLEAGAQVLGGAASGLSVPELAAQIEAHLAQAKETLRINQARLEGARDLWAKWPNQRRLVNEAANKAQLEAEVVSRLQTTHHQRVLEKQAAEARWAQAALPRAERRRQVAEQARAAAERSLREAVVGALDRLATVVPKLWETIGQGPELDTRREQLESSWTQTQAQLDEASRTVEGLEVQLAAKRKGANDVIRALQAISSQLTDGHPEPDAQVPCPVCASRFSHQSLVERLKQSIEDLSSASYLELVNRREQAGQVRRILEEKQTHIERERKEVAEGQARVERARTQLAEEEATAQRELKVDPSKGASFVEAILARRDEVARGLQPGWLPGTDIKGAKAAFKLANDELASADNEIKTLREQASSAGGEALIEEEAASRLEQAATEEERIRAELSAARAVHQEAMVALDGHRTSLLRIEGDWSLGGEAPNEEALKGLERSTLAVRARVDQLTPLAAGFAARLVLAEHEGRVDRAQKAIQSFLVANSLTLEGSANQVSAFSEVLRGRVEAAQNRLTQAEQQKKEVFDLRNGLKANLRQIQDSLMLPHLSEPSERFRRAMAPGLSWRSGLKRSGKGIAPEVTYGDRDDQASSIATMLSEGEQTLVALADLFAMHCVLGHWSRWPGLVLDDPFQSSDVVRISALLDVLRGMALERGTQVILTTHSHEIADWCRRRMKNGGVPTQVFSLHRTASGLEARVSRA